KFLIRASCAALRKLSGVAPPSCCCGSSQRAAILVCHASTMLPLGTTLAAAWILRKNGAASAVVAAADLNKVRRVGVVCSIGSSATQGRSRGTGATARWQTREEMAHHPLHCPLDLQTLSSRSLTLNLPQLCKIVSAILAV